MTRKRLIVNADDFNTDRERNRGILYSAKEGIVTSVSVIANLPFNSTDMSILQRTFGLRIGIHLNLTSGSPLRSLAKSLTDLNNQFYKKNKTWKNLLLGHYNLNEIKDEFAAQINRLKNLNIIPDHIDGNNHIHIFPGIPKIVAQLSNDFGISKIRLPVESFKNRTDYLRPHSIKKYFIGSLAKKAASIFKSFNLQFPDHFAGIHFPQISNIKSLRKFIMNLPEGTTELMCHPGYCNNTTNKFSTIEREQELLNLTHSSVLADIRHYNINLISFNEL